MTYAEKIKQLYEKSLSIQRQFLWIVVEIRACAYTGKAIEEKMLNDRDKLYEDYNRTIEAHKKIRDYCHDNSVSTLEPLPAEWENLADF